MANKETEQRKQGEIILTHSQKSALFDVLKTILFDRQKSELSGLATHDMVIDNHELRALVADLVSDLGIDLESYGPPESLLLMGFADCFSDKKLEELKNTKADSDDFHSEDFARRVSQAADYFLQKRQR